MFQFEALKASEGSTVETRGQAGALKLHRPTSASVQLPQSGDTHAAPPHPLSYTYAWM